MKRRGIIKRLRALAPMTVSPIGVEKIVQREGVYLHAYQDTVGVWTIGTGHTSAAGPPPVYRGMTITEQQNEQILANDLKPIVAQLNATIQVPCLQNQFDAFVSIVFNVGPKFLHSTAMRLFNAGDNAGCAQAIMMWRIPPEIIGRRNTERIQFLTPYPVGARSVLRRGKVRQRLGSVRPGAARRGKVR
jgi:lysozyme